MVPAQRDGIHGALDPQNPQTSMHACMWRCALHPGTPRCRHACGLAACLPRGEPIRTGPNRLWTGGEATIQESRFGCLASGEAPESAQTGL